MAPGTLSAVSRARANALARDIVETLQQEIIAGGFRPGQRLMERELIRRFGVSSIPVREALLELQARGLVIRRHNRGCAVIELSAEEAATLCEFRRALEPKVAAWAAQRISMPELEILAAQFTRLQEAAEANDVSAFFLEDLNFHRIIWKAARNPFSERALENTLASLFASGYMRARFRSGVNLPEEIRLHRLLFNAIFCRNESLAATCMTNLADRFEPQVRV